MEETEVALSTAGSEAPEPPPGGRKVKVGAAAPTDFDRFDFLKTQLSYFVSHLQIADAKAGGIILFAAAMARETGLAVPAADLALLVRNEKLGLLGLLCSLLAILFAFLAIWPRTAPGQLQRSGVQHDVFSWMGVASSHGTASHVSRALSVPAREVLEGIADTVETLSIVIRRKYVFIKWACWALAPATLLNILYWMQ